MSLAPEEPGEPGERGPTLIVAGGGTGGHVLAGVAVADAWRRKFGPGTQVVFVGARGGIEERLVPRAGYPLHTLKLGSLNRVGLGRRIRTILQLPFSLAKSFGILLRARPRAVLGVGGYSSGPLVLMARFLGMIWGGRTAILEQNAAPGMTNRLLGRIVSCVFCAFPGIEGRFPGSRVVVTGNPVRASIRPLPPAPRDPFTVFVFGGSLGAVGINTLVLEALAHLGELKPRLRFIHQTGEKDFERVQAGYRQAGFEGRVERFIDDMPAAYSQASLLVCRAGSSTLAEVAAVGRAAVLIPFPFASDNHQEKNARIFVEKSAAHLLVQARAKGEDLARIVRRAVESPAELDAMERAVAQFYRPNAAEDVVNGLAAGAG